MAEITCQYCKGVVLYPEEDQDDDDQCCTACFFYGYEIIKIMKRIMEP